MDGIFASRPKETNRKNKSRYVLEYARVYLTPNHNPIKTREMLKVSGIIFLENENQMDEARSREEMYATEED